MSNVVIIAGMHRSGTSLASRILQDSGLHIGEDLLPGASDNKYGFFEDRVFQEFHEKVMARLGFDYLASQSGALKFNDDEISYANKIISSKTNLKYWGWKDPRTSLFLDQWDELLERPSYFFVFRPPHEVSLSLINRAGPKVLRKIDELFDVWVNYNKNILEFYNRNRERCILCNIHGMLSDTPKLFGLLEERLGLPKKPNISTLYDQKLLNNIPLPIYAKQYLNKHNASALELYNSLQGEADIAFDDNILADDMEFVELMMATFDSVNNKWISHVNGLISSNTNQVNVDIEEQYRLLLNSKAVRFSTWIKKSPLLLSLSKSLYNAGEKFAKKKSSTKSIFSKEAVTKKSEPLNNQIQTKSFVSEIETYSTYTTEFAHEHDGFSNVLQVYYMGMHGVQSAVAYTPGLKLGIPFNRVLYQNELEDVLSFIEKNKTDKVIIHGHSGGYKELLHGIKENIDTAKIYSIWHGGPSQFSTPIVRESFDELWELKRSGAIDKIAFVKDGMSVMSSDVCKNIVYNFPPNIKFRAKCEIDFETVLIPLRDIYRKNLYSNVLACYASEHVKKIYCTTHFSTFNNKLSNKELHILNEGKGLSRSEIFKLYREVGQVLNVTLAECQPMVLLESLAFGTPCLIGPNVFGALDSHEYKQLVEVIRPDVLRDIADSIERISQYQKKDPEGLNEMMSDYLNLTCKHAVDSYVKLFDD